MYGCKWRANVKYEHSWWWLNRLHGKGGTPPDCFDSLQPSPWSSQCHCVYVTHCPAANTFSEPTNPLVAEKASRIFSFANSPARESPSVSSMSTKWGAGSRPRVKLAWKRGGNNNVAWLGEQGLGYTLVRTEPAKWAIVGAEEAVQSCILDALALDALKVE